MPYITKATERKMEEFLFLFARPFSIFFFFFGPFFLLPSFFFFFFFLKTLKLFSGDFFLGGYPSVR